MSILLACLYVHHVYLVPMGSRRGHQIFCNWRAWPSRRAASAVSPARSCGSKWTLQKVSFSLSRSGKPHINLQFPAQSLTRCMSERFLPFNGRNKEHCPPARFLVSCTHMWAFPLRSESLVRSCWMLCSLSIPLPIQVQHSHFLN